MHYEYENLKDPILPAETNDYLASFKEAEEIVNGWDLTYKGTAYNLKDAPLITYDATGSVFAKLYWQLGVCVVITEGKAQMLKTFLCPFHSSRDC